MIAMLTLGTAVILLWLYSLNLLPSVGRKKKEQPELKLVVSKREFKVKEKKKAKKTASKTRTKSWVKTK